MNSGIRYYRDGREIAEIDAVDSVGTVRRGVTMRVPSVFMDAAAHRPGFRHADAQRRKIMRRDKFGREEGVFEETEDATTVLDRAYSDYEASLTSAWKGDAGPDYDRLTGAGGSAKLRGKSKKKATEEFEAAHGRPGKLKPTPVRVKYDEPDEDDEDDDDEDDDDDDVSVAQTSDARSTAQLMQDHAAKMERIYSAHDATLAEEWRDL